MAMPASPTTSAPRARRAARASATTVRSDAPARRASQQPSEATATDYRRQRQLVLDNLLVVRADLKEALQSFAVRVDGEAARVSDILMEDDGALTRAEIEGRLKCMRKARDLLGELDVKPRKGRSKDLKAVDEVLRRLEALVADW